MDLTFVRHERAIKMEYRFVTDLLTACSNSAQVLSPLVKYEFIVQLLGKITDLEQM